MADAKRRLLTDAEAAELLRLTSSKVQRLVRADQLPNVLLPGGEIRFLEADLWKWIEQNWRPAGRGGQQ